MADILTGPTWSDFIITDAGLRLRTEVIAEKGAIDFFLAEIGEGKPSNLHDIPTMAQLINYKAQASIVKSFADDNDNHCMIIKIDNKDFANEILVTEVAVYAKKVGTDTQVLYGYAYCLVGAAPMPPGASQRRAWNLVFNTKISRTSDVTIIYDGSGVFVTHEEYDNHLPNHYVCTLSGAECGDHYTIEEIANGMPETIMSEICSNGQLTALPSRVEIDLDTGTATLYTIGKYAGKTWTARPYDTHQWVLVANGVVNGDALLVTKHKK